MSNQEPQENQSEVARLLRQIKDEYEAAQRGFIGPKIGNAKHEFITKRMERVEDARQELIVLIGDEKEANKLVVQQMDKAEENHMKQEQLLQDIREGYEAIAKSIVSLAEGESKRRGGTPKIRAKMCSKAICYI